MESILVIVHLFLAIGLVGLILIQHGKGADMGAAFGSGASATVFGSRGASNFLSRTTAILATLFFVTSLALAYFAMQTKEPATLMEGVQAPAAAAVEQAAAVKAPETGDLPSVPEVVIPAQGGDLPAVVK
ncbi:MAG: preprotein translocase subunit SecG [Gammaproteobacteria bacterium]|nr:preprotein translocase subunit SecG [Gammaproteobacteria bacterium]MCB1816371.1 preprotein translocase subunit SecG [Gammaproteobacteria bacterium]MCP5316535.1 preprotein translocase subunit SecG [Chromatiaceae bacterium]MCP5434158.1 preprotein translocase subunit SecG [Chromatiaceae bacterium]HOP18229.1 preprotein translocase subunit SecG [Gammaproteobacteria bacterium]